MRSRGERGSFTIEAALVLPLFMFAFMAIASLAIAAKVEASTQYAIDQTAKEISRYCYIASKANLLAEKSDTDERIGKIDDAIGAAFDFGNVLGDTAGNYIPSGGAGSKDFITQLTDMASGLDAQQLQDDFGKVSESAQQLYTAGSELLKDPKGAISALAQLVAKKAVPTIVSRVIANPLCKALVPKYITSNSDADELFERWGVEGGLDGLDFSMSTFLTDGRSVNVVVVYKLKVNGYGFFDQVIMVKQTASTAAWLAGEKTPKLSEVAQSQSKWTRGDLQRGKDFVAELKAENPTMGVKAGTGIDLYDQDTNTFSSVHSLNVFTSTYSEYDKTGSQNKVDNYTLKDDSVKRTIKGYAKKLSEDTDKVGDMLTMEDGRQVQTANDEIMKRKMKLIVVVPEEASKNQEMLDSLNQLAAEIEEETGVKVNLTYRESALGG